MSEPLTTYVYAPKPRLAPLPPKAHRLGLRMLQLAKEPGEYHFTLIVDKDGRWQLRPPAKVEELG